MTSVPRSTHTDATGAGNPRERVGQRGCQTRSTLPGDLKRRQHRKCAANQLLAASAASCESPSCLAVQLAIQILRAPRQFLLFKKPFILEQSGFGDSGRVRDCCQDGNARPSSLSSLVGPVEKSSCTREVFLKFRVDSEQLQISPKLFQAFVRYAHACAPLGLIDRT